MVDGAACKREEVLKRVDGVFELLLLHLLLWVVGDVSGQIPQKHLRQEPLCWRLPGGVLSGAGWSGRQPSKGMVSAGAQSQPDPRGALGHEARVGLVSL